MKSGRLARCVALLVLLVPASAWAGKTAEQVLEEAEGEFRQQHHRRTVELLRPLLFPKPSLENPDDVHRAREILGASHHELGELDKAREVWQYLLVQRPGFRLDEFYYPTPMRRFFEALRQTLIQQGVIKKAQPIKPVKNPGTIMRVDRVIQKRSRAVAFAPFGVAQFEYGADGWGWFFLTGQAATLLGAAGTSIAYMVMTDFGRQQYSGAKHEQVTALWQSMIVTTAVYTALTVWGVIDGNVRHTPQQEIRVTRTWVPADRVDDPPALVVTTPPRRPPSAPAAPAAPSGH